MQRNMKCDKMTRFIHMYMHINVNYQLKFLLQSNYHTNLTIKVCFLFLSVQMVNVALYLVVMCI